jgi:hypothetical protein
MKTVAGVFLSREQAVRGVSELRSLGVPDSQISLLTPQASAGEVENLPHMEAEQPGVGKALGAVVGGAVGTAGGFELSAALATALIPGVGPIVALGTFGGALIGALAGGALGGKLDANLSEGLPEDELYVYEDALRQGRTLVVAQVDPSFEDSARGALDRAGAETIDRAREMWWIGLRNAEREHYTAERGEDFEREEPGYRAGFEAAQHGWTLDKSYDELKPQLHQMYPAFAEQHSFKHGFERGREYRRSRMSADEKRKSASR